MKPMQRFKQGGVAVALLAAGASYAGSAGTFSAVLSPTSVALNGTSTLTYTLTSYDDSRKFSFTTNLPAGVVIATPPAASSDCGVPPAADPGPAPAITADAGTSSFTLANANPTTEYDGPYMGERSYGCVVRFNVQGTAGGTHPFTAALSDDGYSTGLTAPATLTVLATAAVSAASIPTLSEWGLILLVLAMGASGFRAWRRQR